jgi:dTDP-4-amino-4,6-dideoxygalactose transaminase
MIKDTIVEEIRKYRTEHAERYDNDLKKICEALRRQEKASQKEFVHFGPNLLQSKQGSSKQSAVSPLP